MSNGRRQYQLETRESIRLWSPRTPGGPGQPITTVPNASPLIITLEEFKFVFLSAVGIAPRSSHRGKAGMAFACLGMTQPRGFCLGLVLGRVFVDTVGWRVGWYVAGSAALFLSFIGSWAFPGSPQPRKMQNILHDLKYKID